MGRKVTAEDLLGYFNGLREVILERSRQFQDLLDANECTEEVEEFKGLVHGFLEEVGRFVESVNRLEGKVGDKISLAEPIAVGAGEEPILTPETPVMPEGGKKMGRIKEILERRITGKRKAQVSGEEGKEKDLDKELKSKERMKPGDVIQMTPLLERKETVGSQYDPLFLAEEAVRLTGKGQDVVGGGIYGTVQDAFTELVAKDGNLSKKQIEDTKVILAEMGFKVK